MSGGILHLVNNYSSVVMLRTKQFVSALQKKHDLLNSFHLVPLIFYLEFLQLNYCSKFIECILQLSYCKIQSRRNMDACEKKMHLTFWKRRRKKEKLVNFMWWKIKKSSTTFHEKIWIRTVTMKSFANTYINFLRNNFKLFLFVLVVLMKPSFSEIFFNKLKKIISWKTPKILKTKLNNFYNFSFSKIWCLSLKKVINLKPSHNRATTQAVILCTSERSHHCVLNRRWVHIEWKIHGIKKTQRNN